MPFFADRVKVATATAGAGTVALGAAVPRFRTFVAAAVPNGSLVRYLIEDGVAWEIGVGTYDSGAGTLTRSIAPFGSASSTGALLVLSGTATVAITYSSADMRNGVMASFAATQNINSTATLVWGAEVYDDAGWHDTAVNPSRITVPAGVDRIQIGYQLTLNNQDDNSYAFTNMLKNGSAAWTGRLAAAGVKLLESAQGARINASSGMLIVVPGDYFEITCSSAPVDTSYDVLLDARTFFWAMAV